MTNIHGATYTRSALLARTGDLRQVGGIVRSVLSEGPGKGAEIASLRTGSGFDVTILMDRGMDLSAASFRGVPLAWASPSGDSHPHRFDDRGLGWLRTFPGGLLTTCGLRQTGAPCTDQGEELGLHGRYAGLAAERISQSEGWEGERYVMKLVGEMREAVIFGENILLRREYEAVLGEPRLRLRDVVVNEGNRPTPHMILYHCNFGFPLLGPKTELHTPNRSIRPRDVGLDDPEGPCRFTDPQPGYRERVYYHTLEGDAEGVVRVRLFNPDLLDGLGVEIRYRQDQLPWFIEWKMMGERDYVLGLEPGNALVEGRAKEREAGRLVTLEPGESRVYELEFEVIASDGEPPNG